MNESNYFINLYKVETRNNRAITQILQPNIQSRLLVVNHKKTPIDQHIKNGKPLKLHNDIWDIFLLLRLQIIFKINSFV